MRRTLPVLALATGLGLVGCRTPRGTADSPVVTDFRLVGARAVNGDGLLARLATQGPHCSLGPIGCDFTTLDPDALVTDRLRVEAFYREHGYFAAHTDAPRIDPDGDGRVRITLEVHEGKPVRVRTLTVVGLEVAPEARPPSLPLREGDVFTDAAFDAGRALLVATLRAHGYATAEATQAAQVLAEEGAALVTYTVTPGPRYRFGRIFVAGTASVPHELIVSQAERELKPGDWYDETGLTRAQARVFELGAFAGVRVVRGLPDTQRGTVPVIISIREAPFRSLRLGPGLGFQATRWDADGEAVWTHRNFLGDLRKLQLESRAGYAWLPNPFKPSREDVVGQLAVDFSQPGAIARAVDVSARVELERSLQPAYGFWSERLRLGTPLRVAPRWTLVPTYNLEVYQLHSVLGGTTLATLPPQFSNCPGQVCLLSYVEERVAWDGRDDPINTRRGLYVSLSVQEGFPLGHVGYAYLRLLPEARFYLPIGSAVLGLRARVGGLVPIHETGAAPVVALFASGGAQTMRGYGPGRLAPMIFQNGQWIPTGGNGLVDGTVEVRLPLAGDLGGAVFLDAGNVSRASGAPAEYRTALDPTLLQLAFGLGLRYRTPFGPLRADVAMRLPNDWRPGVSFNQRFPTVPGDSGHREAIAALHITLGEAF
jgi:translocation and assembly module TamA